jgi:hypothetical protein
VTSTAAINKENAPQTVGTDSANTLGKLTQHPRSRERPNKAGSAPTRARRPVKERKREKKKSEICHFQVIDPQIASWW